MLNTLIEYTGQSDILAEITNRHLPVDLTCAAPDLRFTGDHFVCKLSAMG